MRFVDADEDSGYYVDVNSVSFESYCKVNARIAVKKTNMNRMYIYALQFDRQQRTYRIYASQVLKYDTKEILNSADTGDDPKTYSVTSPMNTIVEYLFAMPGAQIPAAEQ